LRGGLKDINLQGNECLCRRLFKIEVQLTRRLFNPSHSSGHYMYHQFNIHNYYVLPTQCIYVSCKDLRTNSDYLPVDYLLTGFYNRGGVCLLRGTDWVFIYILS